MTNTFGDDVRLISERLSAHGFTVKTIDASNIEIEKVWVPGEGGIHNHTLASYGDRSESWKTQWSAVVRWRERILQLGSVHEGNITDIVDYLHVFMGVCYHLKDYVETSLSQKFTYENCALFSFPEFLICRDVANGLKHLELTKPSFSSRVAFHCEYSHVEESHFVKIDIYLNTDIYSYTHTEFINRCAIIWAKYLILKGFK